MTKLLLLCCLAGAAIVVNSGYAAQSTPHPVDVYGPELPIVHDLGAGPAMAATIQGDWLYLIGHGTLRVAGISHPAKPQVVGELTGLGNTRQIVVRGDMAYVASREDGLFLVDVSVPSAPRLVCHYDTIEFATGLALSGDVLFVAQRSFGVELVDVSNSKAPRHLSTVRTGEAQSVAYRNGFLYTGVWGASELVVVDVRDPWRPAITDRRPLDGYGDGVAVSGGYVYVATGHHSRQRPRREPGDPGHGRGHGLEVFSIADPARPEFVSRVKFPRFYQIGYDMWSVRIAGEHAFVADTHNGIFVVKITDPAHPRVVGHHQLSVLENQYLENRRLPPTPAPVGGLALTEDYVYVAGAWTDLHVIAAPHLAGPVTEAAGSPPAIGDPPRPERTKRYRAYELGGQVYNVAPWKDLGVVAAGGGGVEVVRLKPEFKRLRQYRTGGFAMDVEIRGNWVYVAEGTGGLSVWQIGPRGALRRTGSYRAREQAEDAPDRGRHAFHGGRRAEQRTVRQVIVPDPGKYGLLHVGSSYLQIVDLSAPASPRRVFETHEFGLNYGDQIADGLIDGRYACAFWHVSGLYWYDLYGGRVPMSTGDNYHERIGSLNGIAVWRDKILATTRRGGYVLIDRKERRPLDQLPLYRVPGVKLSGKPLLDGETLYVTNRRSGDVFVLDVSDITAPRLREHFTVRGNPARVVPWKDGFLIPGGYEGLLIRE